MDVQVRVTENEPDWWRTASAPCPMCGARTTAPILIDDEGVGPLVWPEMEWTLFFVCPASLCDHMWHERWLLWKNLAAHEQRVLSGWAECI